MVMPKTAEKLRPLYLEKCEKICRTTYLPKELRLELMKKLSVLAKNYGIKFGTCREGLSRLNTGNMRRFMANKTKAKVTVSLEWYPGETGA